MKTLQKTKAKPVLCGHVTLVCGDADLVLQPAEWQHVPVLARAARQWTAPEMRVQVSCGLEAFGLVKEYLEHRLKTLQPPAQFARPLLPRQFVACLSPWETRFAAKLQAVQRAVLYEVLLWAHELQVLPLEDLCCAVLAFLIRGKPLSQMRQLLSRHARGSADVDVVLKETL